jgi:hydrogenase maturation protease
LKSNATEKAGHSVSGRASIVVIGIGNEERADDGAGICVARMIAAAAPKSTRTLECAGDVSSLLELWKSGECVFIVDCVITKAETGTIFRFDVSTDELPPIFPRRASTHTWSVADSVRLAGSIGIMPERLVIYGIEGGEFSLGGAISPRVRLAAGLVADRIIKEIEEIQN